MKNLKSNSKKIFIAFALIASMLFTIPSTAFAAIGGTETWSSSDSSATFTVTNNNLSPVKTIGKTGTLHIALGFSPRPDLDPYPGKCPHIKVTVQIRDLSGNVLASGYATEDSFMRVVNVSTSVTQG